MKEAILSFAFAALMINAFAQTKKTTSGNPIAKPASSGKQKDKSFSVLNKNFLDPGIGLGTYYKGLPFGVSFEHGFTDNISAGAFVNYSSYNYADFGFKLNITYFGVRGSYHFANLLNVTNPKFDPYGGVSLGYYNVSFNGDTFGSPYSSAVFPGVYAGARYMLSDHIGGFAEVGYGVSALRIGASFKF